MCDGDKITGRISLRNFCINATLNLLSCLPEPLSHSTLHELSRCTLDVVLALNVVLRQEMRSRHVRDSIFRPRYSHAFCFVPGFVTGFLPQ